MADAAITEAIRAYLTPKIPEEAKGGFHVEFVYNGIPFKTYFSAHHTDEEISISNRCVDMTFEYTYKGETRNKFVGRIGADSDALKCFDPILKTNARNKPVPEGGKGGKGRKRTTAADVLQILKTKLGLAFPTSSAHPITINDGAINSRILISPFHILRGGDAFYEKYGYVSPPISALKEAIKTFTWQNCNNEIRSVITDFFEKTKKGKEATDWKDETLLMDIMREISWDAEKAYNNVKGPVPDDDENDFIHPSLSYRVFRHFATIAGGIPFEKTDQFKTDTIWEFTLNRESPEWRRCESELVFTNFRPVTAGGSRRSRMKRRQQTKRRATRRK